MRAQLNIFARGSTALSVKRDLQASPDLSPLFAIGDQIQSRSPDFEELSIFLRRGDSTCEDLRVLLEHLGRCFDLRCREGQSLGDPSPRCVLFVDLAANRHFTFPDSAADILTHFGSDASPPGGMGSPVAAA